jgi:hypothetical protein
MTLRFSLVCRGFALGLALIPLTLAGTVPRAAHAQDDRPVRLHAPDGLVDSGLMQHILPRFTLKTQVRVDLVADPASADIVLSDTAPGDSAQALFSDSSAVWYMALAETGHDGAQRFADWLTSDVGTNTLVSFAPEGKAPFGPPPEEAAQEVAVTYEGDAKLGHAVSRAKCTRCHVVDAETQGHGIDSTPSFAVLRSLPDWSDRFTAFYTLNPHPSFTQIAGLTLPFPDHRPSPIVPIELTLDEVDAILAYVATMRAADLGGPLIQQ